MRPGVANGALKSWIKQSKESDTVDSDHGVLEGRRMSVSLGRHYIYRIDCTYNGDRFLCEQRLTIIVTEASRQEIPLCPGGFYF